MALTYSRFDTTPATLIADLKAAITASSDWTEMIPTGIPSTTQTTSLAAAATSVVVGSTTGLTPGMMMVFEPGTVREEYRTVNVVTNATTFTVAALTYAHASGSVVRYGTQFLRATTTRGADMIVDLVDAVPALNYLGLGFYRSHSGVFNGGVDKMGTRYILWRGSTTSATSSMPLHVTVSASKEHLYVSIEGPRASETGATSTQYGSCKNYFFVTDLVPYHAADTIPAVVVEGWITNAPPASVSNLTHQVWVSRNAANTSSWSPGKLASLTFPIVQNVATVGLQRQCSIDGNRYITPYVFFDDYEGIRGRLAKIYYAGDNSPTSVGDNPAPVGETLTYDGNTYRFVAPNNSDGSSNEHWGALGAAANGSGGNPARSVVIAIPVA